MKLFRWLRGRPRTDDRRLAWRHACERALASPSGGDLESLRAELEQLTAPGGDVEVEVEMLDALEQLRRLHDDAAAGALPIVETQHRVVGTEPCHFTAPASLPDAATQTSGRLLVTPTRAIFVGGGRTHATPWHSVHDVLRAERDVALGRADRSAAALFRFNTYGDAVTVAFLARHFRDLRRGRL